jgi:preprotein translocase subunit SecG
MSTIDMILGITMLVICLVIVILGLLQGKNNTSSMTTAITGGSNESHFSKNEGRTKEAIMSKLMGVLMVLLFGCTLAMTIIAAWS